MPVRRFNQLSFEATDVGSWLFVGSNVLVMNESTNELIYEITVRIIARTIASLDFTSTVQYMIHFIYHVIR